MVDAGPTLIMQWLNFGILLFLLYKFLYKPLLSFLDKRAETIKATMEEAVNGKESALKLLEEYKEKIAGIEKEADKIFNDARKKALGEKERIIKSARDEAEKIIAGAKREINLESEKARAELKKEISSMVIMCASKVLEREVKLSDHEKLIEEFINSQ